MCIKVRLRDVEYGAGMSSPKPIAAETAAAVSLTDALPVGPASIVSQTVLQSPEAKVTLFAFAQGQELTTHTNRRRAFVQVLSGTGDFFYNDAWHRHVSGTWLHFPPEHPHAVRATEAFTMLLTLCAEPPPAQA
jgi:quercetin dioxygenase-like cupin family protein